MNTESWTNTQKLLACGLVMAFVGVILLWMLHPPSADAGTTAVLNTLVGTLGGMAGMVVTFYFGSSQGSKDKDDTISNVVTTQAKSIEQKDGPAGPIGPAGPTGAAGPVGPAGQ